MKYKLFYIVIFLIIIFPNSLLSFNPADSSKIVSVEIIALYFDRETRFDFTTSTMLKFRYKNNDKTSFYVQIDSTESLKLERKLSVLLKKDTLIGVEDNNVDLRFLLILNYEKRKSPIYIGFDAGGAMFINDKRYNRDELFLTYSLDYIKNKGIKKNIKKTINKWNNSTK